MLLINSVCVETAGAGTRAPAVNLTNIKFYPSVGFKYPLDNPLIINANLFIAIRQARAVKVFFNLQSEAQCIEVNIFYAKEAYPQFQELVFNDFHQSGDVTGISNVFFIEFLTCKSTDLRSISSIFALQNSSSRISLKVY